MLYVERPAPNIRRLEIWVRAHDATGIGEAIERRGRENRSRDPGHSRIPVYSAVVGIGAGKVYRADGDRAAGRVATPIDNRSRRDGGEAERIVQGQERFPIDSLVHEAGAAAKNRPVVAGDVPGKTESRRKVMVVAVVGAAQTLTNLYKPLRRIEVAQEIVVFLDDRIAFVAYAEFQSETLADAPVILDKTGKAPVVNVPCGIADQQAGVR